MALNIDAKFEGKLTCTFKNGMRNLADFHQSTFESHKIGTLMGSFYPTKKMYELKIYMGVSMDKTSFPVPFNGQNYQKQKGPGTSDQLFFRLRNKFRKIPLLVIHYLTKFDDVI